MIGASLVPLDAELELDLQALAVESGHPFRGTVELRAAEQLDVDAVKVFATVTEVWEEDHWEKDSAGTLHTNLRRREELLFVDSIRVSGGFKINAAESHSIPFEISVPKFQPSRSGGAVSYEIGASVAIRGRPELTKSVSAVVVPGPVSRASILRGVTMTRVVPKEVVVFPCQVCKTLVPLAVGVDRCPKCGRQLKLG